MPLWQTYLPGVTFAPSQTYAVDKFSLVLTKDLAALFLGKTVKLETAMGTGLIVKGTEISTGWL